MQAIWLTMQQLVAKYFLAFLVSLGVLVFFFAGALLMEATIKRLGQARGVDEVLLRFFCQVTRVTMLTLGTVTALGTLGIDVTALVAGLGLTGFALGFALKDVISNALSGILLIVYRPIRHRDQIKVAAFEGVVASIDLRYTILNNEGQQIFVPNSMLFSNAVTVVRQAEQPKMEVDEESELR